MPTIDNPNHSRPLDVHRWSDHPEVKALVEKLWEEHQLGTSSAEQGGKPRTGPKPATFGGELPFDASWTNGSVAQEADPLMGQLAFRRTGR